MNFEQKQPVLPIQFICSSQTIWPVKTKIKKRRKIFKHKKNKRQKLYSENKNSVDKLISFFKQLTYETSSTCTPEKQTITEVKAVENDFLKVEKWFLSSDDDDDESETSSLEYSEDEF